jgi:hypothetical protein
MLEAKTYRSLPPAPIWMQRDFGNPYITDAYKPPECPETHDPIPFEQMSLLDRCDAWHRIEPELTA